MGTMGLPNGGTYSVRVMAPNRDVSCLCPRGIYHNVVFQINVCAQPTIYGGRGKTGCLY
jgi:hypothetical protein